MLNFTYPHLPTSTLSHLHTSASGCRSPPCGQDPLRRPFPDQPLLGRSDHRGPPHLQVCDSWTSACVCFHCNHKTTLFIDVVHVYIDSLDDALLFDPTDLTEDLTPQVSVGKSDVAVECSNIICWERPSTMISPYLLLLLPLPPF